MNIYIMRHAQTTMNAMGKVFSGSTDVSLSEFGIKKTQENSLNPIFDGIDHIYVTPLRRTQETANLLVGERIARTIVPEFKEMDFGDYEGRIITKENESDPVFFKWLNSPREVTFPNGDNLLVHANKAFKQLKIIAREKKYNNVLIISHATTIRLIMSLLITGSVDCFRNIPCNNGCISLLTTEDEKIKVEFINLPL